MKTAPGTSHPLPPRPCGPEGGASLFARLRSRTLLEWEAYTRHEFVEQLGAGTLPPAAFRDYLVQDYLFLIQFARANALAASKSRSLADIRHAADALATVLAETELHVRLTGSWGISRDHLESTPEKQATLAYTRYVLDCGVSGDLLDLRTALAPCAIGYAEIGRRLAALLCSSAARGSGSEHPYRAWIAEYAGEGFQAAAREATAHLDRLAGEDLPPQRLEELVRIFRTATRLESAFWQQALTAHREPSAEGPSSREHCREG